MAPPSQSRRELSLPEALSLAVQLYQSQRYSEAESLCRRILDFQPDQADALHLAGLLAQHQGQSATAIQLLTKAAAIAPGQPDFHNSLGNVLFEQGQLAEAAAAYRQTTALQPNYAAAYSNLGVVLQTQGDFAGALAAFQRALALQPADASAHNNLGVLLKLQGDRAGALAAFQKAVDLEPGVVGPWLNLADVLELEDRMAEAIAAYQAVIRLAPDHVEAYYRLGHIYCCREQRKEAAEMLTRVVQLDPHHAEAYFDWGKLLDQAGQFDHAIAAYRRCVAANPRLFEGYLHLGNKLTFLGRSPEAAAVWQQWLQYEPANPIATHMLAAATGRGTPSRADANFVRDTFDSFAESFDTQLQRLDYQAPQLVARVVELGCSARHLTILDAGCGTGLCGPLLRPYARKLTGVDLSPKMLERARQRGCYDELIPAELTTFMAQAGGAYDLIAAADTFNYFGDLSSVVAAAAAALRPGGSLIFTVEKSTATDEANGFSLASHGRYCHTANYITQQLQTAHFDNIAVSEVVLRMEMSQPVAGLLVAARKATA